MSHFESQRDNGKIKKYINKNNFKKDKGEKTINNKKKSHKHTKKRHTNK